MGRKFCPVAPLPFGGVERGVRLGNELAEVWGFAPVSIKASRSETGRYRQAISAETKLNPRSLCYSVVTNRTLSSVI